MASPFDNCKECRFYGRGQLNMPCRACCFGSKFEAALRIPKLKMNWDKVTFDVTKLLPTQKIVENIDKNSMIPNLMDEVVTYCEHDVKTTMELRDIINKRVEAKMKIGQTMLKIEDVIFNDPATIVFWSDGTKTVVKTHGGEIFDPEKGLAMAIAKKLYGDNKRDYYVTFQKFVGRYEKQKRKQALTKVDMSDIQKAAEFATEAFDRVSEVIWDAVNNK